MLVVSSVDIVSDDDAADDGRGSNELRINLAAAERETMAAFSNIVGEVVDVIFSLCIASRNKAFSFSSAIDEERGFSSGLIIVCCGMQIAL